MTWSRQTCRVQMGQRTSMPTQIWCVPRFRDMTTSSWWPTRWPVPQGRWFRSDAQCVTWCICALRSPRPGSSLVEQWRAQPDMVSTEFADGWLQGLSEPDEQFRTEWVDLDFARKVFYADCDEATAAAALDHLRLQSGNAWTLPCSLTEHPSVSCTSVVCAEDLVVNPIWSRRIARDIGAEIVELPGSHSPFLSRPAAVADVLLRIANGN